MHPILFYITDSFYIGTYGVMVALGALAGLCLAMYRANRAGISTSFIVDLLFYATIAGFIGARVAFILVNFRDFTLRPFAYIFSREGFVFLGGLIAAIPVAVWYTDKHKMPRGKIADILAPSLPLAHMFGRFGCFSAGCCFGKVCSGPLSQFCLKFPAVFDREGNLVGSFVYIDHVQQGLVPQTAAWSLPVVPTQLIEAGSLFIIVLLLLLIEKKIKLPGGLFIFYLVLYSVARFFIEFLRGDVERGIVFGFLSTSQIISLLICLGIIIYWVRQNKGLAKGK